MNEKLQLLAANRMELQSKLDEEVKRMKVTGGDSMELEFTQASLARAAGTRTHRKPQNVAANGTGRTVPCEFDGAG